jgi:hypothetical protein
MRDEAESGEDARREQIVFGVLLACGKRTCWTPPAGGGVRRLRKTRSPMTHLYPRA